MANPQVMIQFSDDSGHTWSHEQWKPLVDDSKNYLNRVRLHRGGSAFGRLYRLTFSGDSSFTLISAHGRLRFGN